jgi:DNA-directed RNA polymerase sigma subunit (sigma70/sigma32)
MDSDGVDTALDSLAAQVRARPPLPLDEVAELLGRAHGEGEGPARTALAEHHLDLALDAALAHGDQGVDVGDLYQEASVAVVTAVAEYAARRGDPAGLRAYVRRVVDLHVDAALRREEAERETCAAFVRDSRLLDAVEVEMRHRLERPPTTVELATVLGWSQERVEMMSRLLEEARQRDDESLLPFLDDLAEDTGAGGANGAGAEDGAPR